MGCKRLDTDFLFFLEVETSKELARTQKKDLNVYPFGLEHKGYNNVVNGTENNFFTYNGKELNESLSLNVIEMDWRQYDPALGRFNVIDALADSFVENTPYHFGYNNPISYIDPTGLFSIHTDEAGNVLKNVDDGDYGVYVHQGATTEADIDKTYSAENTSADGEKIGELGGVINADKIYTNTLANNISEAEGIWNPWSFKNKVTDNGEWDLKNNTKTIFGLAYDGETQFSFQGELMSSEDIGNHHFGAVALAVNLFPSEKFILKEAGKNQMTKKGGTASRPEWQPKVTEQTVNFTKTGRPILGTKQVLGPPYGDDPIDQKYIKKGFEYYKSNK